MVNIREIEYFIDHLFLFSCALTIQALLKMDRLDLAKSVHLSISSII